MPRVSEKQRLIHWYLQSINAYMQQTKLATLLEALEGMEDCFVTGGNSSGSWGA